MSKEALAPSPYPELTGAELMDRAVLPTRRSDASNTTGPLLDSIGLPRELRTDFARAVIEAMSDEELERYVEEGASDMGA